MILKKPPKSLNTKSTINLHEKGCSDFCIVHDYGLACGICYKSRGGTNKLKQCNYRRFRSTRNFQHEDNE